MKPELHTWRENARCPGTIITGYKTLRIKPN